MSLLTSINAGCWPYSSVSLRNCLPSVPLVVVLAMFKLKQEEFAVLRLFIFALISFQSNPWRVRDAWSLAAVGGAVAKMVLTQPVSNGRFEVGNPGKRRG